MHTICRSCWTGKHSVGHEMRCWVIQQQHSLGWKSTCSQILRCVLESRIQVHPTVGRQKLDEVWYEHGFDENTYFQVLARLTFRFTWTGYILNCLRKRITFMSNFNDIDRTKKSNTDICMHKVPNSSHNTGASWCLRQKIRGGTQIPTSPRTMGQWSIANGWHILVSHWIVTLHTKISSDRAIIAWTIWEKRRNNLPLPRLIVLIKTMLAGNLLCICNCMCQWVWNRK